MIFFMQPPYGRRKCPRADSEATQGFGNPQTFKASYAHPDHVSGLFTVQTAKPPLNVDRRSRNRHAHRLHFHDTQSREAAMTRIDHFADLPCFRGQLEAA
jgi:hypothetical protein